MIDATVDDPAAPPDPGTDWQQVHTDLARLAQKVPKQQGLFDQVVKGYLDDHPMSSGDRDAAQTFATISRLKANGAPLEAVDSYLSEQQGAHQAQAAAEVANQPDNMEPMSVPRAVAADIGSAAGAVVKHVPGIEPIMAGARAVTHGQSYRDAYDAIEQGTGPQVFNAPERMLGALGGGILSNALITGALGNAGAAAADASAGAALPDATLKTRLLAKLATAPTSAAKIGAVQGGLSAALDANPDRSLTERAIATPIAALAGAGLGKLTDVAATGGRSLAAPDPDKVASAIDAVRAAAGKQDYPAAIAEGNAAFAPTPEVQAIVQDPILNPVLTRLQGLKEFQGKPLTDPDLLVEGYKELSRQVGRAMNAAPTSGSVSPDLVVRELRQVQESMKDAMTAGGDAAYMPSFPSAVANQAEQFDNVDALGLGNSALRSSLKSGAATKGLLTNSRQALLDQASDLPDDLKAYFASGVEGAAGQKMLAGHGLFETVRAPFSVANKAANLLNESGARPASGMMMRSTLAAILNRLAGQ